MARHAQNMFVENPFGDTDLLTGNHNMTMNELGASRLATVNGTIN